MTELTLLIKKRSHIKAKVTRLKTFLDFCVENKETAAEIGIRLEKVDEIFNDYEIVQTKIEELNDEQSNNRASFETSFYGAVVLGKSLMDKHTKVNPQSQADGTSTVDHQGQTSNSASYLPKIDIPKFDGSWEKWLTFRDTNGTLVHEKGSLKNIEKLHYLKWALTGEALSLIDSLEVTGDNYEVA